MKRPVSIILIPVTMISLFPAQRAEITEIRPRKKPDMTTQGGTKDSEHHQTLNDKAVDDHEADNNSFGEIRKAIGDALEKKINK